MNENCGCCEGVEEITPVSITNRPGLSALVYRVGTHATFLETMVASLASFSFEPAPEAGAESPANPMTGLTTREASDASIAFLDAWATVADVLTFYQERIANEGFLGTATERRSMIELARLVGYKPRPGVASSVYLAYTLDPGSEVVVPEGTRAQSVPGPEELPQSFETAEDLKASARWNTLQPRLTRPQSPRMQLLIPGQPLYLKGTATNLKANDPLLIDFDGLKDQRLFRVIKVEADQAADRTKVTFEPWVAETALNIPLIPSGTGVVLPPSVTAVRAIIARHRRAEDFGVNANTRTAERILNLLNDLENALTDNLDEAQLRRLIADKLPPFREEYRLAREANFTKLAPWIGQFIAQLEDLIASTQHEPGLHHPALVELSRVLGGLRKPPARNPSSPKQLGRSVSEHFDAASDTLPKLLTAFQPGLSQLYRAWRNLPVTRPTRASVYALRTRASVFGHNAPPRPILSEGTVVRYEEWTLATTTEDTVLEHFHIDIEVLVAQETFKAKMSSINVILERPPGTVLTRVGDGRPVTAGTYIIPLLEIGEEISVTVHNLEPDDDFQMTFDLVFKVRGLKVKVDLSDTRNVAFVTCTGINNSAVIGHTARVKNLPESRRATSIAVDGDIRLAATVEGGSTETPTVVSLDATFDQILPGSWVAVERPAAQAGQQTLLIRRATSVREATRADYGITAKGTQLQLDGQWLEPDDQFKVIRGTSVLAQSELMELAEAPLDEVEEAVCGNRIELADLVEGLEPGRWLIITGERTDIIPEEETDGTRISKVINLDKKVGATAGGVVAGGGENAPPPPAVPGVRATELIMLAGVEQGYDADLPGDATHTTLLLARELAYCYKLDTVRIYGNVVRATHGETRTEVMGSGDASQPTQSFTLRQSPLTYTSAATPSGVEAALNVRVNDILWHETETLAGLSPTDRNYVTKTDDQDQTTVIFGNGREGARLPTGVENVKAAYRTGIGQPGNVRAEQISLVVTKPLGVKEVINPLAATGGANREDRDQIRSNAPLAVTALDRLISARDYEDFAPTFAGIGKASALRLSDGHRQLVHLTIAGTDDIPISEDSDLFKNLGEALLRFGDPFQPIKIARRLLKLLVISAKVRLDPDYLWESVEPKVRRALIERFSFRRRALGQDVVLSEVISTIQGVEGVVYTDVDTLDAIEEDITADKLLQLSGTLKLNTRIRSYLARIDRTDLDPATRIRPAQLALLTEQVPETLVLTELK